MGSKPISLTNRGGTTPRDGYGHIPRNAKADNKKPHKGASAYYHWRLKPQLKLLGHPNQENPGPANWVAILSTKLWNVK